MNSILFAGPCAFIVSGRGESVAQHAVISLSSYKAATGLQWQEGCYPVRLRPSRSVPF